MTSDATPLPAPADPPKGPSNLRLRVIWGALAAALLIGCTFGGPLSFGLFFAGVQAVMLKEFYRIMRASGYKPAFWWGIVAGTLLFLYVAFTQLFAVQFQNVYMAGGSYTVYPPLDATANFTPHSAASLFGVTARILLYLPAVGSVLLLAGLIIREIVRWPADEQPFTNVAVTLLGLCYISIPMSMLVLLAHPGTAFTPGRVFCLIFFVWAADTGAYFAGKAFGKHKLAPSISPGKTWEGWAGGAVLTLIVGWAAGYFLPDLPLAHRLVAAGVVAVFGPLGDLAESMLKRSAGVKDSGTFLPGHGGLLDRFDAFLLVLPVLALLQALLG